MKHYLEWDDIYFSTALATAILRNGGEFTITKEDFDKLTENGDKVQFSLSGEFDNGDDNPPSSITFVMRPHHEH